jgi:hypothetical protein
MKGSPMSEVSWHCLPFPQLHNSTELADGYVDAVGRLSIAALVVHGSCHPLAGSRCELRNGSTVPYLSSRSVQEWSGDVIVA